ncbi:MAG: matrixin family metalloprotease, partial [Campylobacterales bacterium]|nr:matrixin family metalloprotease [Campylobacterales bacterium]
SKVLIKYKYSQLNNYIDELNRYIENFNKRSDLSKDEYDNIKQQVLQKQKYIKEQNLLLEKEKRVLNKEILSVKNMTNRYNLLVKRYNRLLRENENLSRDLVEIKGVTKGTTTITYLKENGITKEKSSKSSMDKIEIYGFEDLNQLKVVLAHEIAHLVGVEHVDAKGALMNPILQKEQLEHLLLSSDDIEAFNKIFLDK